MNLKELYRSVHRSPSDAVVAEIIKRWSGAQTADLSQWQDETGAALLRVNASGVPTGSLDVTSKSYVDQTATPYPNLLLNGGFDFAQRKIGTAAPYGLGYTNARAYQMDRWAVWSSNVAEIGSVATASGYATGAVFQGSSAAGIARNAGNVGGNTLYLVQEIDRPLVATMIGQVHRLSLAIAWSGQTTPASVTLRLLTGTNSAEVANPTYATGNTVVATTTVSLSGAGNQRISLPIPSAIAGNVAVACVQLLITPTIVAPGGGDVWLVGAAMLHRSYNTCTFELPWRRMGKDLADEHQMCCRFFEASSLNLVGPAPWSVEAYTALVGAANPVGNGGTIWLGLHPRFRVPKRTGVPTIVFYNPATGATGTWAFSALGASAVAAINTGSMGFTVVNNTGSNVNYVSQFVTGHWTASAEI
jgi:hypothetical protein